jgi:beta-glucosidase-like glycosyl hydrolase
MQDPRWGRNDEVPSEDPLLAGEYAKHYTQGMQQRDSQGYLKMHASIKHFTAYSVEANRQAFNGNIDTFNLHDTYLPAFEKGVREGQSGGAMCSYASINGIPSCANSWLFEKARNDWNQSHFLISTDCGAVNHMQKKGGNHYATNVTDAIVKTLKAGTDLEMGDSMYQTDSNLQHAIEDAHLASEEDMDHALYRVGN